MFKFTDKARAQYLLEVRANGKYRLWHFVRFNRHRYLVFGIYIPDAAVYFAFWGSIPGMFGFLGLSFGILVTDLSWLRGRNKSWPFTSKTTNWDEVQRLANS
jgi:hypothetical protein